MADSESPKSNPKYGMSGPMSLALPEPLDNQKTADLVEELKREKNYENEMGTKKRMATLKVLNKTTQEFVREVSRKQGLPQSQINQFGGKVYPYGSYRLGVFGPGSDIDTLAVAPKHVKREDFFNFFPDILRRVVEQELAREAKEKAKFEDREFSAGVTSLVPVPDSFVPIIKLILNGIEIDLIFASITTLQTIPPKLNLNDNSLLMHLDQSSIRAITGPVSLQCFIC
jgi:poly(A) polymerase